MPTDISPPPEARLITELREKPPRMSMREAARESGIAGMRPISETRWRQIENGYRPERGVNYPESGPAQTVARMAAVVGVTPQQMTEAGRPDVAGELEAILAASPELSARQRKALNRRIRRDIGDS
jgi:hypothetical protein